MREKPFILGVNGSPNRNGHVSAMLARVLKHAKRYGARVRTAHLADYEILPHSGRLGSKWYREKTRDDMSQLHSLVLKADGIVFASPTHWFSMSSHMKLFIDRLTSLEDFNFLLEGKVVGFVVYGPQGGALNNAMLLMMIASSMGMVIPPYAAVFDEGRGDRWLSREYGLLAKNIVQQIKAGKTLKLNWGYPNESYILSPIELIKKPAKRKRKSRPELKRR